MIKLDNKYKSMWDVLVLLSIAYNCCMVAFYVTFSPIDELNYLDIVVEFIFAFDMILRFFHEYKDPESFEIVSDIRRISKKYLK